MPDYVEVVPRARPVVDFSDDPGRTKQEFKDDTSMENILARFRRTGLVDHVSRSQGTFEDVSEIGDFRSAMEAVRQAEEFFMNLPAALRAKHDNDTATFLDWMNSATREQLEEAGLTGVKAAPPAAPAPEGAGAS